MQHCSYVVQTFRILEFISSSKTEKMSNLPVNLGLLKWGPGQRNLKTGRKYGTYVVYCEKVTYDLL